MSDGGVSLHLAHHYYQVLGTGYKEHGTRQGTSVWYKVQDTRQGTKCKVQQARYKVQSAMGGVDFAPSAAPT